MCGGREGGVAGRAPPASAEGTAVCLRRAGAVLGPPARLHPGLPLRLPDRRPQLRDLPLPPAAQEVQAHLLRQELPVWIPVRISGGDALLGMVCDLVTRLCVPVFVGGSVSASEWLRTQSERRCWLCQVDRKEG